VSTPVAVTQRRTSLAGPIAVAVVVWTLGLVGNAVAMLVTDWTGWVGWLAVPAVSLGIAVIQAVAAAHVETQYADPVSHRPVRYPGQRPPSGRSLPAVLLVLLVAGLLILVATIGVRFVAGWVTGDEPGEDRLAATVTQASSGLEVSVTSFEETRHFTRLGVRVTNGTGSSITLPLFHNVSVVGGNGSVLEVDDRRSDWSEGLNPGVSQTGVLIFSGHLPDGVRKAQLQFNTVFAQGFDGPRQLTVSGIELQRRSG
jgi:hypothetical protein